MRVSFCIFICLLGAMSSAKGFDNPRIEVLIPPIANTQTSFALLRARRVAAEIFAAIGVSVAWRTAQCAGSECSVTPVGRLIEVAFSQNTAPNFHPGALAIARPYADGGPRITIFLDRLQPLIQMNPRGTEYFLGHLLAHELGHVLQGVARHSETGVLRKKWSAPEIFAMRKSVLSFTRYDAELILEGIRHPSGPTADSGRSRFGLEAVVE